MYNLIECVDNYSKISGNSYQLCRDEPESIKFKSKLLDNTNNAGVISKDNRGTTFAITDTKLYVPAVTLSTP